MTTPINRPKRVWSKPAKISLAIVTLVLAAVIGAAIERSSTGTLQTTSGAAGVTTVYAGTTTVTVPGADRPTTVTVTATPVEPAKPAGIGSGIHKVGPGGIDAGRYTTDNTSGSCYYARLKNDSGDFSAIITNNNLDGPGSLTVKAGEFLEISGTCVFRKAS